MPQNLIAEFTVIYIKRDADWLPPFVSLETQREHAEAEALDWAEKGFGAGRYRPVGGEFVGKMQARRWGEILS